MRHLNAGSLALTLNDWIGKEIFGIRAGLIASIITAGHQCLVSQLQ